MTASLGTLIELRLTPAVAQVCEFDNGLYPSLSYRPHRHHIDVTLDYSDALSLLSDLEDRTLPGHFDQPLSWYRVARIAVRTIRAVLSSVEAR